MIIFHQNNEGHKKIVISRMISKKVILILWLSWTVYVNTLITKDNIILIIT